MAKHHQYTQGLLSFAAPTTTWKPPRMSELPTDWNRWKRLCLDFETCDPHLRTLGIGSRRGGYIVGFGIAFEDGPAFYVPMRHALGGNVESADAAWRWLCDGLWSFQGIVLTTGGAYDHDYFRTFGGRFNPAIRFRDCAIDEALINERAGDYDLDSMLIRYGLPPKDEDLLEEAARQYGVDPKKDLWRLPGTLVGAYGLRDVTGPLELSRLQEKKLEAENLWGAVETESQLLPVVVSMRMRGVPVDQGRLMEFGDWAERQLEMYFQRFRHDSGYRGQFGLEEFRSAKKLDVITKAVTGRGLPETSKGNPQISEEALGTINHPAYKHLVDAKGIDTVLKTFYQGTIDHLTNGKIHTTFKQLVGQRDGFRRGEKGSTEGAAFGRMASSHTNMQNQPNPEKDPEIGGRWRSIYVPDPDEGDPDEPNWVCADFSQQEPRWAIHWAEWLELPGAKKAGDMLRANKELDPYEPLVKATGLPRGVIKILYLARTYNQGEATMCENLGLPTVLEQSRYTGRWFRKAGPEGRAILEKFDSDAPYIKGLQDECTRRAKERKVIILIDGQRCRFLVDPAGNCIEPEVATNRLLQGNAGRQTKKVLIEADRQGLPLRLVVHDDISLFGFKYADQLVEIMENTVKTSVPMRAKRKIGRDYAEASGYGKKKIDGVEHEFRPCPDGDVSFMDSFQWVPVSH